MKMVFIGLSVTSSWGNGHATTYRSLLRALRQRGHDVTFLERDVPWYADHRDLSPKESPARVLLYDSVHDLSKYEPILESADAVIVGSYVPDGALVCEWVLERAQGVAAFYDIDTPVTLAALERDECEYMTPELIPWFDLYLSFAGGETLTRLETEYGSPCARPLYCSVDPALYFQEKCDQRWDMGYLGTYSDDRQPGLERLLVKAAETWMSGQFVVAGPQYPSSLKWPGNVERIDHLSPAEHRAFYNSQRFTLNVTRADMIEAGFSPSVRLFEAAACGTPIISDWWEGLDDFFEIGAEILVAGDTEDVLRYLRDVSDSEVARIGRAAQRKVLSRHSAAHRAEELEGFLEEVWKNMVMKS